MPVKTRQVKHLADHSVTQIALTWDRAILLYRYKDTCKFQGCVMVLVEECSSEHDAHKWIETGNLTSKALLTQ